MHGHQVDLTMNNVNVMNQGRHGSCTTFAATTAIDASVYQSDYISQLCLLEMLRNLDEVAGNEHGGWEGADIEAISAVIKLFGVIPKALEAELGCGGFDYYPIFDNDIGEPMTVQDYLANSELLPAAVNFNTVVSQHVFLYENNSVVARVKKALNAGHRVVAGFVITNEFNQGFHGSYQHPYDTWTATYSLQRQYEEHDFDGLGGHAVVIYGYDDNAIVDGQKGVFYIRNSWGIKDYDVYATYDFARLSLMQAVAVESPFDVPALASDTIHR